MPPTPPVPISYLAQPPIPFSRGILVLHAWWGLTPFIQSLCDRLAAAGFTALAPDLYHGATAATIAEAKVLRGKLKRELAEREITQAAEDLCAHCGCESIGVLGFSLGGYFALWYAEQPASRIAAAVIFYGTRQGDYTGRPCAFQFHLAESDVYESKSGVKKLQKSLHAAGQEAEFHSYPGTSHWFFESDQPAYQGEAAELAWERTLRFFSAHLG